MLSIRRPAGRTLLVAVLTFTAAFAATVASAAGQARVKPCNGSPALCSRPFDQVTLPGSHNSMSNAELGWKMPNQTYSIPHQLERGARAMLIDTHYGRPIVVAGRPGVQDVTPANYNPANEDRMYLCHAGCGMGASDLIEVLRQVRDFLKANPREVLLFDVEDDVKPDDFAAAVDASGLADFVYRGGTAAGTWLTLAEMIETGQRVVFLHESNRPAASWYPYAYGGTMQETPYSWPAASNPNGYTGVQFLTDPAALPSSCVAFRGGTTGPLFLMNHWVSGDGVPKSGDETTPRPGLAEIVNTKEALVARARACEQERGIRPTILAVDFFGTGDVVGAARELNGVQAAPFLETGSAPRPVTVRAGRTAIFRLRLDNLGDAPAGPKVCATLPKKLGAGSCATVTLAPAGRRTVTVKIRTRSRAKGHGRVTLTVTGAGDRLTVRTSLRVKPKPKRRHRR